MLLHLAEHSRKDFSLDISVADKSGKEKKNLPARKVQRPPILTLVHFLALGQKVAVNLCSYTINCRVLNSKRLAHPITSYENDIVQSHAETQKETVCLTTGVTVSLAQFIFV